ncbi:MAG: S24/S26 family peptidase [Candidatus Omnitrophica bacterium]|nr:S24/S26 family peptidase [Candidatus Omnitrophota bacterium]
MNSCSRDCSNLANIVPCCRSAYVPPAFPYNVTPLDPYPDDNIFLKFFDFKTHLLKKDLFTFKLRGLCMYPFLKDGDILKVEHKNAEEIRMGDFAVFKRNKNLCVHRVINKGIDGGLSYITTKSDSQLKDDGPTFDKDILGIVTHVERKGRTIRVLTKDSGLILQFLSTVRLRWFYFLRQIIRAIIKITIFIQRFRLYRSCAMILFNKMVPRITYTLRFYPLTNNNVHMNKDFSLDGSHKPESGNTDIFLQGGLFAFVGSKQIASLSFVNKPTMCPFSGWWVYGLKIRVRFRCAGIEEELFLRLKHMLASYNVSRIYTQLRKNAAYELFIYKNMGFKKTDSHADTLSLEQNTLGTGLIMECKI